MNAELEVVEVPHQDDMTIKNFYRHMQNRHPMQGIDFDVMLEAGAVGNNGAYQAFLSYHARIHALDIDAADGTDETEFDHFHSEESEFTNE